MNLTPISQKKITLTITAIDVDGAPVTLSDVGLAFLEPKTTPHAATAWTHFTPVANSVTVILSGSEVTDPPVGAMVASHPLQTLWLCIFDDDEVEPLKVGRVQVS